MKSEVIPYRSERSNTMNANFPKSAVEIKDMPKFYDVKNADDFTRMRGKPPPQHVSVGGGMDSVK